MKKIFKNFPIRKNLKFLIVFGFIKKLVILLILICPFFSSGQTNPYSDKFAHTYSIVAKDDVAPIRVDTLTPPDPAVPTAL